MARHRAVLRWLMQFRLANSLPSSTLSAIQSWKKEVPDQMATSKSDVSRREFLRTAGGISSIALVGGLGVSFASKPAKAAAANTDIKNYGAFCDFNPAQVKGVAQGPLAGLQMGVKDVFDIGG